jgi:hypothetical protein
MPVNLIGEDEIREALRPRRPDPRAFEAKVRERLESPAKEQEEDPLAGLSPLLRSAAALLPIQVITGGKAPAALAAKLIPAGGAYKLLGYLLLPALSLLMLVVAALASVLKIRSLRPEPGAELVSQERIEEATRRWWSDHKRGVWLAWTATLVMMLVGQTWLLFLMYLVSFGLLLFTLSSYAKIGLGSRTAIGGICVTGFMILGQFSGVRAIGDQNILFFDQRFVSAVFWGGALVLMIFLIRTGATPPRLPNAPRWLAPLLTVGLAVMLIAGIVATFALPLTPARIARYVESFPTADDHNWEPWQEVADWTIEQQLAPDLAHPRRAALEKIAEQPDRKLLAVALQTGLLTRDDLDRPEVLRLYREGSQALLRRPAPADGPEAQDMLMIYFFDWVIRAAVMRGELEGEDRDYVEHRLHITLDSILAGDRRAGCDDLLGATRLLAVINRPVDPARYRERVHQWLMKLWCPTGNLARLAGGFSDRLHVKRELPEPRDAGDKILRWFADYFDSPLGTVRGTSLAVELMQIYGAPATLDVNWVRSFLRPTWENQRSEEKWILAVTRDRLNHLPGVAPLSWLDLLYYERALLAAVVLVGLCIYATVCAPKLALTDEIAPTGRPLSPSVTFSWLAIAVLLAFFAALMAVFLLAPRLLNRRPALREAPARAVVRPEELLPAKAPLRPEPSRRHRKEPNPAPPAE